ncbi:ribosome small subunit-dependent GTPase A [Pediococcus ethanolidurans]|uniref:ribosome small subunit-dependent GTPase A n=1 Tax=Pediococcus ethanolidurans TaxID=319653 RepID=UPI002955DE72|nr:ribosome small subunit-dependent GTPase A [Pediococcus ethanolidurans]MDV7718690.1 ribosome small subunit-dependent GTPase A [Pediococcus ethanolidurans]
MNKEQLKSYGLTNELVELVSTNTESLTLGRVIGQNRTLYNVVTAQGFLKASVSGRLNNLAIDAQDYPAVGDWVGLRVGGSQQDTAVIERLFPRHSLFLRKAAGRKTTAQIVAANVDTIFICMALDANYNLNRLERYLVVAWDSGATPVVVLTKADLAQNYDQQIADVINIAAGAEVVACSTTDESWQKVTTFVHPGKTIAFIGSSGVGKTTLINHLMGSKVGSTQAVRTGDAHGRHTTTGRELLVLPSGGIVIDTPGMRELALLNGDFETTFEDIEELAQQCKFNDCTHTTEPGCAVQAAIEAGTLTSDRLHNYQTLKKEATVNQNLRGKARENAKLTKMFGSKQKMKAFVKAKRQQRR